MFKAVLLCLLAFVMSAQAFAPVGGKFLTRAAALNMNLMPAAPKAITSDKNIVDTIAGTGSHGKLSAAIKAAGLDGTLAGAGPFTIFAPVDAGITGDASADVLKFHVSMNQQLPTRNGRSYVSLLDEKEVGIRVTVDTCESFCLHGKAPPAKMSKVGDTIKCTNGYIHVIDAILEPYEGTTPPSMFLKNTDDPELHN